MVIASCGELEPKRCCDCASFEMHVVGKILEVDRGGRMMLSTTDLAASEAMIFVVPQQKNLEPGEVFDLQVKKALMAGQAS